MASQEQIELLRQCALEEQLSAAADQRLPNRRMLDELGSTVLHDFAPVACVATNVHYLDFDPLKGYTIEPVPDAIPVSGSFGGFMIQPIELEYVSDDSTEKVDFKQVSYLVQDTSYRLTGYMCPVETTQLYDVVDHLDGDGKFDELCEMLAMEHIDMAELGRFFRTVRDLSKMPFYIAYVRSVITPSDVYSAVFTTGHMFAAGTDTKNSVAYTEQDVWFDIGKTDVFTVGRFGGVVNQELAIRKGRRPCTYIPLQLVVGTEMVPVSD